MTNWIRQHLVALSHASRRARRSAGSFLFNAIVIAAVLALPFAALTLFDNLLPVTNQLEVDPEVTVFLESASKSGNKTAIDAEIRKLAQSTDPNARVRYIPRDQALAALKTRTSIGEAVAVLGENPLPDSYVIRLASSESGASPKLERLVAQLTELDGVDQVQIDSAWINRLAALTRIVRLALLGAVMALAIVVVAVVFNTVRLQVLTQREEIDVCRLFGATDAFVSRPFYYSGALLGLVSGALALAVVAGLLPLINPHIVELAGLYGSEFRLEPLGVSPSAMLLGISMALGCVGAGLSVRRHLQTPVN